MALSFEQTEEVKCFNDTRNPIQNACSLADRQQATGETCAKVQKLDLVIREEEVKKTCSSLTLESDRMAAAKEKREIREGRKSEGE